MSNKNTEGPRKRPYILRARAQRRDDVHRRITLAAVYLHGAVGPARTTISDIAERAGVRRATVYNHFPTDLELIDSCSSHWFGEHPPPDPAAWLGVSDPVQRAKSALEAMYEYYDGGHEMLQNVLRDAPLVPALAEILRLKWQPLLDAAVETLAEGWDFAENTEGETSSSERANSALRASLKVALNFFTWQTLAASGLSNNEAAQLALTWLQSAGAIPR